MSVFGNLDLFLELLDPGRLERSEREAMTTILRIVERNAKRRTPVKTGRLQRSVAGVLLKPTLGAVGTSVIYGPFVHARKPFLTEGLADSESEIGPIFDSIGTQFVGG